MSDTLKRLCLAIVYSVMVMMFVGFTIMFISFIIYSVKGLL